MDKYCAKNIKQSTHNSNDKVLEAIDDFYEEYGTIIPGVKIRNFIPNTEIDLGFPIYYGSQNNYGLALQIKLNVDF